jgi:predicted SprT family Zn-dependent metalloprotease
MAETTMQQHGLADWTFEFDRAKRRAGQCDAVRKRITLSVFFAASRPIKDVLNIVLHEIAHALVGCEHGHDEVWHRKAVELGCDGERYVSSEFVMATVLKACACMKSSKLAHRVTKKMRTEGVCRHCNSKISVLRVGIDGKLTKIV